MDIPDESYVSPDDFFEQAVERYKVWKKASSVEVSDEKEESEEEVAEATSFEETEDDARTEILEFLSAMPPFDFQAACAKLVAALGHEISWISDPGPDGGLDFIGYRDPIGASGRRIKGQVKRQQSKQDVDDVHAFISKIKSDDVGVFIALGGFTKNAHAVTRSDERRLLLLDGGDFVRLWIGHYDRLDEDARNLLRLKPVWHLVRPAD